MDRGGMMANRQYKLFYDVSEGILFDENDVEIPQSKLPYISTNETIDIVLQICNSQSTADVYTLFSEAEITPSAVIDNNWTWFIEGELLQDIETFEGMATRLRMQCTKKEYINPSGLLYVINDNGQSEQIQYDSYEKEGLTHTFHFNHVLLYPYAAGDKVRIAEPALCASGGDSIVATEKDTGKFKITISAANLKYIDVIRGLPEIKNTAFELQVKSGADNNLIFKIEFGFRCLNVRDFTGVLPAPVADVSILDGYVPKQQWEIYNPPQTFVNWFDADGATFNDVVDAVASLIHQIKN